MESSHFPPTTFPRPSLQQQLQGVKLSDIDILRLRQTEELLERARELEENARAMRISFQLKYSKGNGPL